MDFGKDFKKFALSEGVSSMNLHYYEKNLENSLTHHFGGSTDGGVTSPDKPQTHNFRNGSYEYWGTTGISESEYNKKVFKTGYERLFGGKYSNFEEYIKLETKWYQNQSKFLSFVYQEHNDKFVP